MHDQIYDRYNADRAIRRARVSGIMISKGVSVDAAVLAKLPTGVPNLLAPIMLSIPRNTQAWSECGAEQGVERHSVHVSCSRGAPAEDGVSTMDVAGTSGRASTSGLIEVRRVDMGGNRGRPTRATTPLRAGVLAPPTPLRPGLSARKIGSRSTMWRAEETRTIREGVLVVEEGDILVRVDDVQVRGDLPLSSYLSERVYERLSKYMAMHAKL